MGVANSRTSRVVSSGSYVPTRRLTAWLRSVGVALPLLASPEGDGARGGLVELGAQTLQLQGAVVDASGQDGGSDMLAGGGERGASMSAGIPLADHLTVDAATQLLANACVNGDSGWVIAHAAQDATTTGQLGARGGLA